MENLPVDPSWHATSQVGRYYNAPVKCRAVRIRQTLLPRVGAKPKIIFIDGECFCTGFKMVGGRCASVSSTVTLGWQRRAGIGALRARCDAVLEGGRDGVFIADGLEKRRTVFIIRKTTSG